MMPIVNGLESDFAGQVAVVRLDANDPAVLRLQGQWGGRGHPFFALVDSDGQLTELLFGSQTVEVLRRAMTTVQP